MADTGALSPGTMANNTSVGTKAWATPDNAKVADGTTTNATVQIPIT
jgi:hypothetical protein